MSITPEWFLRARNGLGPAVPPAALHAIMGSDTASYNEGSFGDGNGDGVGSGDGCGCVNGFGTGHGYGGGNGYGGGGNAYASGRGSGRGSGNNMYDRGRNDGSGDGRGNGYWPDPAVYFEEEA